MAGVLCSPYQVLQVDTSSWERGQCRSRGWQGFLPLLFLVSTSWHLRSIFYGSEGDQELHRCVPGPELGTMLSFVDSGLCATLSTALVFLGTADLGGLACISLCPSPMKVKLCLRGIHLPLQVGMEHTQRPSACPQRRGGPGMQVCGEGLDP